MKSKDKRTTTSIEIEPKNKYIIRSIKNKADKKTGTSL